MARGHSLVPGLETGPFHIIIRDKGHTKAAGVGVQCGGRRFTTHPVESQVGVIETLNSGKKQMFREGSDFS